MNDPYKTLHISPDASDEEVKKAYRELAKKYHPDRYQNSPLAEQASEKMKEINAAYEEIMSHRKNAAEGSSYGRSYNDSSYYAQNRNGSRYSEVRILINNGRFEEAEEQLRQVVPSERSAEWYYLMAVVSYHKGWLEEAYNYGAAACRLDPSDAEYRSFFSRVTQQRNGSFQTRKTYGNSIDCCPGGCCEYLSCLLCSDCLCHSCCN